MVLRRRSVPGGAGAVNAVLRASGIVLGEAARGLDQLDAEAVGIDQVDRAPAAVGANRRGDRRRDALDAARLEPLIERIELVDIEGYMGVADIAVPHVD